MSVEELVLRWQEHGDRAAREQIVQRYLPLARRLALRYTNPHEPLDDLVQVASVGLLGAIDRFCPERNVPFQAFAVPTILGELKRYFRNTGWSAHVPRRAQELALRVDRAVQELTSRSGQPPHVEELADVLGLSLEDVLCGLDASTAHYAVSYDGPAGGATENDEPLTLGDRVGEHDDRYGLVDAKLSLASAMTQLPFQERRALRMRIDDGLKQSEIAERLGCSQMQVSRLLRRAAERLRALMDPELPAVTAPAAQVARGGRGSAAREQRPSTGPRSNQRAGGRGRAPRSTPRPRAASPA